MDFKKLLMFETLVSSWIIRVLYWILQGLMTLGALVLMFQFLSRGIFLQSLLVPVAYIVQTLVLRLVFESIIVYFRNAENIEAIRHKLDGSQPSSSQPKNSSLLDD